MKDDEQDIMTFAPEKTTMFSWVFNDEGDMEVSLAAGKKIIFVDADIQTDGKTIVIVSDRPAEESK